jgi:Domain of unknown function (DUF4371)/hAT family C-terminal dimerisation region
MIQNDIIKSTAEVMREAIVVNINAAPFFTVIADGTTDSATKEQLSTVIRFVKDGQLEEAFLGFEELNASTGAAIAFQIIQTLKLYGLDLSKMRGQGYDGCAAMKGDKMGCQAIIRREFPKALFMHCSSHCLNLVIAHAAEVQSISNCIGTIKEVTNFIRASAKRMHLFKEKVADIQGCSKKILSGLCETRWVERHETVTRFVDMYPAVLCMLEDMLEWADTTTSSKAAQFIASITSHRFLVALCVCARFSSLILPVSKALQNPHADLIECTRQINDIAQMLSRYRQEANTSFHEIFEQAQVLAHEPVTIPRRVGRQTHRANYPTDDAESFYRQAVYIPYLDGLMTQLTERFSIHMQQAIIMQKFVPRFVDSVKYEDIRDVVEQYHDDIPDASKVRDEFERWQVKWVKDLPADRPGNAIDTLAKAQSLQPFYPNIFMILTLFATLPITTASAERSFSCLRRLKNYLRTTMGQDRLSGLAMMEINRSSVPSPELVIDRLGRFNRKLGFVL